MTASLRAALLGAAAVAALAVTNTALARRAERRTPPRGRFVTAGGLRLHVREAGAGPAVLLLHGNVVDAQDFWSSGVAERLARTHRVVAFDRPGFGHTRRPRDADTDAATQARLMLAGMEALGILRAVLVGHSWGTLVALAMALDVPERVEGLVLLSGYYQPERRLDVLPPALNAVPVLGPVLRNTTAPWLARLLLPRLTRKMFAPRPVPARFAAEFAPELAVRPAALRAAGADAATMRADAAALMPRWAALSRPLHLLAGADDRIVAPRHAAVLHGAVPGSELEVLPGIGHMLHHADPDAVVRAVQAVAARARGRLALAA